LRHSEYNDAFHIPPRHTGRRHLPGADGKVVADARVLIAKYQADLLAAAGKGQHSLRVTLLNFDKSKYKTISFLNTLPS
jgi:hypothetical protein